MLVIREEIPWSEEEERGELATENTFCYEFSAVSLPISNRERMQVTRDLSGISSRMEWKQPNNYFALHVSFAHISPTCGGPLRWTSQCEIDKKI